MEKYNTKKDLTKILNISFSIASLIIVFSIFSFFIILPIFLLSKYNIKLYTYIVIFLIIIFAVFLTIRKIKKIYSKYKQINKLILKIIFSWLIILISLILFTAEALFFNILKDLSVVLAYNNSTLSNAIAIILLYEKAVYAITLSINLLNPVVFFIALLLFINAVLFKFIFEFLVWYTAIPIIFILNIFLIISIIIILRRIYFGILSLFNKTKY